LNCATSSREGEGSNGKSKPLTAENAEDAEITILRKIFAALCAGSAVNFIGG
jgi:hypothetical protein